LALAAVHRIPYFRLPPNGLGSRAKKEESWLDHAEMLRLRLLVAVESDKKKLKRKDGLAAPESVLGRGVVM
jgi:hypothetical protein